MGDMKCPFCQQKLDYMGKYTDGSSKWLCNKCGLFGDERLFDEIICTRKALDVARNGLEYIFGYEGVPKYVAKHVRQVLDQIKNETALKQKDVK